MIENPLKEGGGHSRRTINGGPSQGRATAVAGTPGKRKAYLQTGQGGPRKKP